MYFLKNEPFKHFVRINDNIFCLYMYVEDWKQASFLNLQWWVPSADVHYQKKEWHSFF